MNSVAIMGRLVRDPEVKELEGKTEVCTFSVAVKRPFGRKDNDTPDYFDCQAWNNNSAFIARWFQKGKPICITGYLCQDRWQDKDGNNRSKVFIKVERASFSLNDSNQDGSTAPAPGKAATPVSVPDDDIPF